MKYIIDTDKLPCNSGKNCTTCPFWSVDDTCEITEQVKKLPKYEEIPQWIPCSERLPEKVGNYLVSDIYGNVYSSYFDYLKGKKCFIYDDDWDELTEDDTAIAWKPLPEPYKKEENK
jgi:hypothetical protein